MNALRAGLPALPRQMIGLPIDERGFPVPWFVSSQDGKWDFRVIRPGGILQAIHFGTCWICGNPLGVHKVFAIGPMCAVNRVTSEPPSHRACAVYAAQACPFMVQPKMKYQRAIPLPDGAEEAAGFSLDRNPGVTCLWTTRSFKVFKPGRGNEGVLIDIGDPERIEWYAKGREAEAQEIVDSVLSGLPFLHKAALAEGPRAVDALRRTIQRAKAILPPLPELAL